MLCCLFVSVTEKFLGCQSVWAVVEVSMVHKRVSTKLECVNVLTQQACLVAKPPFVMALITSPGCTAAPALCA